MPGKRQNYDSRQMYDARPKQEVQKSNMTETRHEIIKHPQKFVRYKEGAKLYSICQPKFEQLAWEANAVYKLNKVALVNLEILDKYLETFRVVQDRRY